jgi:molybdenum cofactor cytidylyltransferase
MIAGLILAGGASRRVGSPKALLEYGGETFLDRLITALGAHCSPVIVVLGHDAERIRADCRRGGDVTFVLNPEPERGQLTSLQCGLRAVPAECEGVMFTPVDYPKVRDTTVAKLAAAVRGRTAEKVIAPQSLGVHGHPVFVAKELIPEFLGLPESASARDVIHRWRDQTAYVEVDDGGVVRDIDNPESYRKLLAE